jgi:hypothetical protein
MFIYTTNALEGEVRYYKGSQRMWPDDIPGFPDLPPGVGKYNDYTNAMYMYASVTGFAAVVLLFFRTDYKRLEAEAAAEESNSKQIQSEA